MKYAISRYRHEQWNMAYSIYISDTLYYQNQQKALATRFYDMINRDKDDETADDIALDVIQRAGLRVKE